MDFAMPNISQEVMKEAVKEAIKEWLTEQKAELGTWTLKFIICAFFAGAMYMFFLSQGWHK